MFKWLKKRREEKAAKVRAERRAYVARVYGSRIAERSYPSDSSSMLTGLMVGGLLGGQGQSFEGTAQTSPGFTGQGGEGGGAGASGSWGDNVGSVVDGGASREGTSERSGGYESATGGGSSGSGGGMASESPSSGSDSSSSSSDYSSGSSGGGD